MHGGSHWVGSPLDCNALFKAKPDDKLSQYDSHA